MDQSPSTKAVASNPSPSNFSAYVGNLRSDISVDELKDRLHSLFENVGVSILVTDIQVYRKSRKKPSFGFVVIRDKSSFDLAVEKLNGRKDNEIVLAGKEFLISAARRHDPPPFQPRTTTETSTKLVRKNSKKGKQKPPKSQNHKSKNVKTHGVVMATRPIPDENSLKNGHIFAKVTSSSLFDCQPSCSGLSSLIPNGRYFYIGQKLGTEDRVTEYKQGRGRYLDYQFKIDVGKYVCAFLNSEGGTLLIGVKDDCTVCGTEISTSKREDQLRLQIDKIMKGFNPSVFPNLYSIKFIPVYPFMMNKNTNNALTESCHPSLPEYQDSTNVAKPLPDNTLKDGDSLNEDGILLGQPLLGLSFPPVPQKPTPLRQLTQESNTPGLANKTSNTDNALKTNFTPVNSVQDKALNSSAVDENTLKVIEIFVQSPPRPSGGQRTLYQNHKREVFIRLDGSVHGPLLASEIVEWGRCNMAESLHMEHDYLKQQVHRKQEEITMNLKLVDDLVKQKQFLEDHYKEKESTLISEIDKLRTREKEIEGELEQVKRTKSKVCVIF